MKRSNFNRIGTAVLIGALIFILLLVTIQDVGMTWDEPAYVELNPVVRLELYKEAQRMIIKSVPAAFFYNNVNAFLIKPFVKNITTTPMDSAWAGIYSVANIKIEK